MTVRRCLQAISKLCRSFHIEIACQSAKGRRNVVREFQPLFARGDLPLICAFAWQSHRFISQMLGNGSGALLNLFNAQKTSGVYQDEHGRVTEPLRVLLADNHATNVTAKQLGDNRESISLMPGRPPTQRQ